jgi:hypothetical protein
VDTAPSFVDISAAPGSEVVASESGHVVAIGLSPTLGRYLELGDGYGTTYTYAHLGSVVSEYRAPAGQTESISRGRPRSLTGASPSHNLLASQSAVLARALRVASSTRWPLPLGGGARGRPVAAPAPARSEMAANLKAAAASPAGLAAELATLSRAWVGTGGVGLAPVGPAPAGPATAGIQPFDGAGTADSVTGISDAVRSLLQLELGSLTARATHPHITALSFVAHRYAPSAGRPAPPAAATSWRPMRVGGTVLAGTVLGHLGTAAAARQPYLRFSIEPTDGVDPARVLDNWRVREHSPLYRGHSATPSIGQALLMSDAEVARLVLGDPRIAIYPCGRSDIAAGAIDRRILGALEYLADAGLHPGVSALRCGHARDGAAYAGGEAADISSLGGQPVLGHQYAPAPAYRAVEDLLTLQGSLEPGQIDSLMSFPEAANTVTRPGQPGSIAISYLPPLGAARALPATAIVRPPASAPTSVARVVAAGDAIAALPDVWGGGHTARQDIGYDCSGSVSYALAGAGLLHRPLTSSAFERWGQPGRGRWITVYATANHVFMIVAGRRFDTATLADTGTRWSRATAAPVGFVARHPPGL